MIFIKDSSSRAFYIPESPYNTHPVYFYLANYKWTDYHVYHVYAENWYSNTWRDLETRERGRERGWHKRQDGTRVSLPSPLAVLEVSPRRMRKTGEPVVRSSTRADTGEMRGEEKRQRRLEGVEWEKRRKEEFVRLSSFLYLSSRIYPTPEPTPREYLNDRRIYIYYPCNEEGNLPVGWRPPPGGIGSGMKGNRR